MSSGDEFVERMWAVHRERVLGRLAVVLSALEALADGQTADRDLAGREAHALAGGLGTYGRPGSDLLRTVELALAGSAPADWAALAVAVREVMAQAVAGR